MKEAIFNLIDRFLRWLTGLTAREQQIIAVMVAGLSVAGIYTLAESVAITFADLNTELEAANQELTQVATLLSQYSKVKAQRDRIENEFKSVEFKEDELKYLEEDLIGKKLGLKSGSFSITRRSASKFGANYEQHLFTIKFTLSDLKLIMDFLNEVVSGPQPLLLTRLDVRVTRNGEALEVDMDVSSITQARG